MNTATDMYQMVATIVKARKSHKIWEQTHVERYADDDFYAFSRGNFLVALTNKKYQVSRKVTYQPFAEGQTVCNIFYSSDCLTVSGGALQIALNNGESKIYVVKGSSTQESENAFLME